MHKSIYTNVGSYTMKTRTSIHPSKYAQITTAAEFQAGSDKSK